jgi:hypothetical protein
MMEGDFSEKGAVVVLESMMVKTCRSTSLFMQVTYGLAM